MAKANRKRVDVNRESNDLDRKLAQARGICACVNVAQDNLTGVCRPEDMKNALWALDDLLEGVQLAADAMFKGWHIERVERGALRIVSGSEGVSK